MKTSLGKRIQDILWSFSLGVSSPRLVLGVGPVSHGVTTRHILSLVSRTSPRVKQPQRWLSSSSPALKDRLGANSEEDIAETKREHTPLQSIKDRRVWVNLWDAAGTGYEGARTHSVTLPEDAIVEDLIDAVHAKNSAFLQGIGPAQLKVYRDAEHFHTRDTEGPLRASTLLKKPDDLEEEARGASEETALIVLVPSPSPSVSPMEFDEPSWPPFDPSSYRGSLYLNGSSDDENNRLLEKGLPLLARDEILEEINTQSARQQQKYMPFIISTSRGMGKTFLLKKIGTQEVPKGLENKRIQAAMKRGRVLSFDFLLNIDHAPKTVKEASRFLVHLMVFFLCRIFAKKEVDGIHFEKIQSLSDVTTCKGTQEKFQGWISDCRRADTSEMIVEYIRLTNIAFRDTQPKCSEPPVFLFDEVQVVCKETELESTFLGGGANHTILTIILTRLATGQGQPICICTGTNDGRISKISAKSAIDPQVLSLTCLTEEADYTTFWNEMTRFRNAKDGKCVDFYDPSGNILDKDLFTSLVYASCQIPRLLYLAHEQWYEFKLLQRKHKEKVLLDFEERALRYYSEMGEIWDKFSANEIAHIALSCGVHLRVNLKSDPIVPGTSIAWKSLIDSSLVFPYADTCFMLPFQLIWNLAEGSKKEIAYNKRKEVIEICKDHVKNLDLDSLFVSYDKLCSLQLYELGIWFESFFISSLAAKYYLCALTSPAGPHRFTAVYDIVNPEDMRARDVLSQFMVDFSDGISTPDKEALVNKNPYGTSIIHNKKIITAHHDAIIPATRDGERADIAVQAKASFRLHTAAEIDAQICVSKGTKLEVPLLIWLYLGGNTAKEEKHAHKPVIFLDASGCCNGSTLNKFKLLKRLRSTAGMKTG